MLAFEQTIRRSLLWPLAPPAATAETPDPGRDDGPQLPVVALGQPGQLGDSEALDKFLRDYFGLVLPSKRCCERHSTPHAAFHHAFFAVSPICVWKASRGFGGKSFTLSTLGLAEATLLRADVNVLGGSGEQSKRVLESMTKLWEVETAPRHTLLSDPGSQKQRLKWGNRIVALMASQASVRGPHPQRLRMDEVDEMDLGILDSALGQPMSKGWVLSQVVLSSTHQYADGTMAEVLKRAAEKGWPVFEWCYRENLEPHGWLSLAEVERKRATLTQRMWETEIELQEPTSEGRAIDPEAVAAAFRSDVQLEDPVPEGKYGTGADWAKKKNHTVVVTIRRDVRPMRVVAIKRANKQPWPKMAGYLDAAVAAYGGTSTHDNTGLGQVVHDLLNHDSEPFNMVGRDRQDLLSEYIAALEKGELVWPAPDPLDQSEEGQALTAAHSEHKYATRDDVYKGSKDGTGTHHLPDTISAAALAYRAAAQPEPESTMHHQQGAQPVQTGSLARLQQTLARRRGVVQGQIPNEEPEATATEGEPAAPVVKRERWRRPGFTGGSVEEERKTESTQPGQAGDEGMD